MHARAEAGALMQDARAHKGRARARGHRRASRLTDVDGRELENSCRCSGTVRCRGRDGERPSAARSLITVIVATLANLSPGRAAGTRGKAHGTLYPGG